MLSPVDHAHKSGHAEKIALAAAVGEFLKYWGFKEIYGRIWTLVFLAETPLTASQIVKELNVTKGLVSMALAELLNYGVLERVSLGNAKSPGYVSSADLGDVITAVLKERELRLLRNVRDRLTSLKESCGEDKLLHSKLRKLESVTALALDSLERLLSARIVPVWKWRALMRLGR